MDENSLSLGSGPDMAEPAPLLHRDAPRRLPSGTQLLALLGFDAFFGTWAVLSYRKTA